MNSRLKLTLFCIVILSTNSLANWETIGGNSARTSYVDAVGPESPNEILWEGSIYSKIGYPILISGNKLVTERSTDLVNAPIICHDLFSGDTLWSLDFPGDERSPSVPIGFLKNIVYASKWTSSINDDTLYAIDANNGEIIWHSSVGILGAYYLGIAFTEDADIILPTHDSVARIDHKTGERVWCTKRDVPVIPSYCGLSVFKETLYGWELGPTNKLMIIAIDVETGGKKYNIEIPTTNPPVAPATGPLPVIDNNGIIYAFRADDNLVALNDDGDSLSIVWNIQIRNGGYTKPAIGPDGSVYFTNHKRIMRADSSTGQILDSSIIIYTDTSISLNGYFAIDRNGMVFFNNNNYNYGALYSFTPDLQLNWIDSIKGINYGGPALSKHGLLAVAGADNILRVYRPVNLNISNKLLYKSEQIINNFYTSTLISFQYYIENFTNVKLILYNMRGQEIYRHDNLPNTPGFHIVKLGDIQRKIGSGQFIYQFSIGKKFVSNTFQIVK